MKSYLRKYLVITHDEYIDFGAETIVSEPAVDLTHVDWRQKWREKNIAGLVIRRYCFNQ